MSEEVQKIQAEQPKLHQPPPPTNTTVDGKQYTPARQDLRPQDVNLIENFIGGIYGEAKQIESNNIGDNQFTKALKIDAAQEIVNVRKMANGIQNNQVQPKPQQMENIQTQAPPVPKAIPLPPVPGQQMDFPPPQMNTGDSLILKHEIDQLKEQLKDIKKLYDEFFKLKLVKGSWKIKTSEKTQSATTISKAWNVINKLLKNKASSITIEYVEDE